MSALFNEKVSVADNTQKTAVAELLENPIREIPAQLPARLEDIDTVDIPPASALADLRAAAMAVPVHVMMAGFNEYIGRRKAFRLWLKSQMTEGVHFGYSPGCLPKFCDGDGNEKPEGVATHVKSWNSKKNGYDIVPMKQWTPKPPLYAAGADFVTDLLGVRDEYKADLESWQQLGSVGGQFVQSCYLYSRSNDRLLGEGKGVRQNGQRGGDANNAIKMAMKSAKVCAVLNTWGLRDLFTQDEPPQAPEPTNENPQQKPNAAKAQPRGERPKDIDLRVLFSAYKECRPPDERNAVSFALFAKHHTSIEYTAESVVKLGNWTKADIDKCRRALEDNQ